ncbi:MAG: cohesin domain-containing protein [Patescibacteria group bacterium]|nr:cohesin domain-containing protein [Patescibacteria group bacterium]
MRKILPALLLSLVIPALSAASAFAAGTLSLTPQTQTVKVGDNFNVTVKFDTGGETVKSVAASITFPASLLSVATDGIQTTGTAITNWKERIYSNQSGTINLTGDTATSTSGNVLATITFTTKALGTASVAFDSGSQILRTADSTNILDLKTSAGGTYTIAATLATTTTTTTGTQTATTSGQIPNNVGDDTPTKIFLFGAGVAATLGIVLLRRSGQTP